MPLESRAKDFNFNWSHIAITCRPLSMPSFLILYYQDVLDTNRNGLLVSTSTLSIPTDRCTANPAEVLNNFHNLWRSDNWFSATQRLIECYLQLSGSPCCCLLQTMLFLPKISTQWIMKIEKDHALRRSFDALGPFLELGAKLEGTGKVIKENPSLRNLCPWRDHFTGHPIVLITLSHLQLLKHLQLDLHTYVQLWRYPYFGYSRKLMNMKVHKSCQ